MTPIQLKSAFDELGLRPPYGLIPGSRPEGEVEPVAATEESWNAYGYNPPYYTSGIPAFKQPDKDASDKPAYYELELALTMKAHREEVARRVNASLEWLKEHCRRRIGRQAYNETDITEELLGHVHNKYTPEQHAERARLVARYKELTRWVTSLERTSEELTSFNPTEDSHWE